jgi:hypothetical protein
LFTQSARAEFLDAVIPSVAAHVDVPLEVHRDPSDEVELVISASLTAPFSKERTVRVELLDAIAPVVADVDIASVIDGYSVTLSNSPSCVPFVPH